MTAHRAVNIALTAGLAVGIAAILGSSHLLDDNSAEWEQSTALRDEQKQAQAEARRERAAQQLCIKIAGPGVAPVWDADGRLVCRARKGGAKTTVVAGGQL
jgi:hypothetical protein